MARPSLLQLALADNEFCKRLKDPFQNDVFHLETYLTFTEAAKLPPGNAGSRRPNQKTNAYKAMLETAETTPQTFHVKNRGIIYFCERFEYDNAKKLLSVTIPSVGYDNEFKYGIADGAQTFSIIHEISRRIHELESRGDWSVPSVRVHFVAGTHNLPATDDEIIEALNTSSQAQQFLLDDLREPFEELKDALQKAGFDVSQVAFRENEDKEWHIFEIIRRMACFLPERWQLAQPVSVFRSKAQALDLFANEKSRVEFRRLYDVIRDIVTLPEFIEGELVAVDQVKSKQLAGLRLVKTINLPPPPQRHRAVYQPEPTAQVRQKLHISAALPMAAAFRELLILRGDRYAWRVDPRIVFRNCAESLYRLLLSRVALVRTPSLLGSDAAYWYACIPIVMRAKDALLESKPDELFNAQVSADQPAERRSRPSASNTSPKMLVSPSLKPGHNRNLSGKDFADKVREVAGRFPGEERSHAVRQCRASGWP